MQRYFVEISYNGTDFFGWQRQPREISVQEVIEVAFTKLNSNEARTIVGCGRTDTGVHAKQYFFHVELEFTGVLADLEHKLNRMLPKSIAVHSIVEVDQEKHARFSARKRTYRYFISTKKDAFQSAYHWYLPTELDLEKMNDACKTLIGKQDFTSLSKLHTDVKTNICDVTAAFWTKNGNNYIFEITADRFLRNMVRATVGTLVDVGTGKLHPTEMTQILKAKDRQAASMSVPACGLFLWEIVY